MLVNARLDGPSPPNPPGAYSRACEYSKPMGHTGSGRVALGSANLRPHSK